jgi:hypothetical protein
MRQNLDDSELVVPTSLALSLEMALAKAKIIKDASSRELVK